jgi:hypothetical protein
MKTIRYDPPVDVSGYTVVVVSIVKALRHETKGACAFIGEKRPIAVICRSVDGESIFGVDGRRLDKAALQRLISQTGDSDGASAT